MAQSSNFAAFWRLVRPHALPRLPLFVLATLLTLVGTGGVSLSLLLIPAVLPVLFPGFEGGGAGAAASSPWVEQRIFALRDWIAAQQSGLDPALATVFAVAGMLVILGVVASTAGYGAIVVARYASLQVVISLRMQLARHLMGLSVRYHGGRKLGDLLSRVSADVGQTLAAIDLALKELVREPGQGLFMVGIAIYAAPQLAFGVLVAMPLMALPVMLLARRVRRGSKRSLGSLGASVQALSQMFSGVRTVKAFRAEERELDRYRELNRGYLRQSMRMVRAVALSQSWTSLVSMLGFAAILILIGVLSVHTEVFDERPGQLLVFIIAIAQAYQKLKRTTNAITRVQESMGAADRLNELLDESVDVVEVAQPARLTGLGVGVRIEALGFRYPGVDREALADLELEIRPGEKLAVVGPSGSGKSTLMDLLARFIDPDRGRITVDGVDLREVSLDDWTSMYAMVGQVPFLFHTTILENIRYGRPGASDDEVHAAARAAHIHDFVRSLPDGYATDVADAGSRLSGGQRQRIAIARAVLKGAPLLLLDEATSALDSESEAAVQGALDELMEGRTVVVVAHRLSTVRNADRIAVLEEGRLVELGTHEELLERGGTYARLHELQSAP